MITKEKFEKEWNEAPQGGDTRIVVLMMRGDEITADRYEFSDENESIPYVKLYYENDFIGSIVLSYIKEVD